MNQLSRAQAIPFIDLAAQRRRIGRSIDDAVARVMGHCQFINGPEVTQLEAALAAFSGAKYVVTCDEVCALPLEYGVSTRRTR